MKSLILLPILFLCLTMNIGMNYLGLAGIKSYLVVIIFNYPLQKVGFVGIKQSTNINPLIAKLASSCKCRYLTAREKK